MNTYNIQEQINQDFYILVQALNFYTYLFIINICQNHFELSCP